jgi:hypothetical protein
MGEIMKTANEIRALGKNYSSQRDTKVKNYLKEIEYLCMFQAKEDSTQNFIIFRLKEDRNINFEIINELRKNGFTVSYKWIIPLDVTTNIGTVDFKISW